VLDLIGREEELFTFDMSKHDAELTEVVSQSRFLVLGGAGSIGQAVSKEIFKRSPKKLHVVDISENNLVELVRDIRSSYGYIRGDFQTFALDIGSIEYDAFIRSDGRYDFVLNLTALKHVRSEKDPFTLMRMIDVNILNTEKTLNQSIKNSVNKYFCVSTDKAANPVNMMGASKRIMEMFLMRKSAEIDISTARFANVAFSDGSLLHGFNQRISKGQPIVAPKDIKRYFISPQESGELCLLSCIFGINRDIFFPKMTDALRLTSFSDIAIKYLKNLGYLPYPCHSEDEARELAKTLPAKGSWPCLFTDSDTSGEKDFEEFFTQNEILELAKFDSIGIIKNSLNFNGDGLEQFLNFIKERKASMNWSKAEIIDSFKRLIPEFNHKETRKYLDGKM
jgi:FlaA1/EpsC-like NDP-sugar epimerase